MAKTYRMSFSGGPAQKLALLKKRAAKYGVSFTGTIECGRFSGMGLTGSYRSEGNFFIVTIASVPFVYTFDSAAAQIQAFLNE